MLFISFILLLLLLVVIVVLLSLFLLLREGIRPSLEHGASRPPMFMVHVAGFILLSFPQPTFEHIAKPQ